MNDRVSGMVQTIKKLGLHPISGCAATAEFIRLRGAARPQTQSAARC